MASCTCAHGYASAIPAGSVARSASSSRLNGATARKAGAASTVVPAGEVRGQGGDGAVHEDVAHRDRVPGAAQRAHERDGADGVPAEVEEALRVLTCSSWSTWPQIPASRFSSSVAGATYAAARRHRGVPQGGPVDLAVGVQRDRLARRRTRPGPCTPAMLRTPLPHPLRQLRARRGRPVEHHSRSDSPTRATASPPTPSVASTTASISPSSIRYPRIFTWWSTRPTNSTPRRATGAPGPRCGTSAPRPVPAVPLPANGSGTNRSAVSAGLTRVAHGPRPRRRCTTRRPHPPGKLQSPG